MNLEDLLQQYGEDQRQQAKAAARVQQLSRREAWWRTGVACMLVLGAVGIVALRHTAEPQLQAPLIAEADCVRVDKRGEIEDKIDARETSRHRVSGSSEFSNDSEGSFVVMADPIAFDTVSLAEISADMVPTEITATPAETSAFTLSDFSDIELSYIDHPAELSKSRAQNRACSSYAEAKESPQLTASRAQNRACLPTSSHSRFRFTASIGASYSGRTSLDRYDTDVPEYGLNSIDGMAEGSSLHVTPQWSLMARVGMNYTIVQNERHHLDVGIGLDGYTMQNEVRETTITSGLSLAGDVQIDNRTYNVSAQCLYLDLPLVWNTHHHGADKMGWQYSLTPARELFTFNMPDAVYINPWKLTLGFGITIPRCALKSVSLTVNVLSTYKYHQMHELGIILGF